MKLGDADKSYLGYCVKGGTRYYTAQFTATALATLVVTANRFYAMPFFVPINFKVDRIAFNVTAQAAGQYARVGIYHDNGLIYPGSLVLDGGEFVTTSGIKETTISLVLFKGRLYWLVFCASSTPTLRSIAVAGLSAVFLGLDSTLPTAPGVGYYYAWTYAALPAIYPAGATIHVAAMPGVFLRAA